MRALYDRSILAPSIIYIIPGSSILSIRRVYTLAFHRSKQAYRLVFPMGVEAIRISLPQLEFQSNKYWCHQLQDQQNVFTDAVCTWVNLHIRVQILNRSSTFKVTLKVSVQRKSYSQMLIYKFLPLTFSQAVASPYGVLDLTQYISARLKTFTQTLPYLSSV